MLKKKTAWYVLCRAVREKAVHMVSAAKRGGGGGSAAAAASREAAAKTSRRLEQIQRWLGFDDAYLRRWQRLAAGFLAWLAQQSSARAMEEAGVRGTFPKLWKRFLEEEQKSDVIAWDGGDEEEPSD